MRTSLPNIAELSGVILTSLQKSICNSYKVFLGILTPSCDIKLVKSLKIKTIDYLHATNVVAFVFPYFKFQHLDPPSFMA